MNTRSLGYWIPTVLFSLAMGTAGAFDLSGAPDVVAGMDHLGFPTWFAQWLGGWKLAGVTVLLLPGLPRLKEWATAGFIINLSSASVAHLVTGDPVGNVLTPFVFMAFLLASWAMRPASRRLGEIGLAVGGGRVAAG